VGRREPIALALVLDMVNKTFAMPLVRSSFAPRARSFGRGPVRALAAPLESCSAISDELKLFAATFLAGFLFVSILIG
jgi:hypothetical protein